MTRPRRSRPSRVWQVEPLEDRALLTTVYGPAALAPLTPPSRPKDWWFARPAETASFDQALFISSSGQFFGQFSGPGLVRSANTADERPAFGFSSRSDSITVGARPILVPGSDLAQAVETWRLDREPDGTAPPPPFLTMGFRAVSGLSPPSRGVMPYSFFARARDEMDGGMVRIGLRPFFLPISPETDWENGINDNPADVFTVLETESHGAPPNASADRAESSSSEGSGRSQAVAASSLPAASSGMPASSVMIWVDVERWAGENSLASVVLSRGAFEPGALFPQEEPPELTALLASLLSEVLGEPTALSLPLSGPLQQVTTLDPLDESSLALTATLVTVSSDPQPAATSGPGPVEQDASRPDPPSWAGFVIGLDEAFEANRLSARRWPAAREPYGDDKQRQGTSEPAPTDENAAVDEAIQRLAPGESSSPALEELFLRVLGEDEEDDEEDPTLDRSWQGAAGAASLSLVIIPALWAERLGSHPPRPHPQQRQNRNNLDNQ